jgi:hypothetical protein
MKLTPDPQNPNKLSEPDRIKLQAALAEFGDLGVIVVNKQTGLLVGGHQRISALEASELQVTDLAEPDPDGTVARGWIERDGRRFTVRVVDWDETKAHAALLAANRFGRLGADDPKLLSDLLAELTDNDISTDLAGYTPDLSAPPTVNDAAKATAETLAAEHEWQPNYDGTDKRSDKLKQRIDSLQSKQPQAMEQAQLIVLSPDHAEALVIVDDSLGDVIAELRRYVDNGTPSPLAELLERVHPL